MTTFVCMDIASAYKIPTQLCIHNFGVAKTPNALGCMHL